jgi:tRNA (mo5U34)-methyltransferase
VSATTTPAIEARVRELAPWFQNVDLHGVPTAPAHALGDYPALKWRRVSPHLPTDLSGRTVLDIGCNAGFYSVEMKKRGAARVLGLDVDPIYLEQARFVAATLEVEIELRQMNVYEVASLRERFDVVLFMGVLYHLRHPLLALDLIHEHVARDLLVCQSLLRGSDAPLAVPPDHPFSETAVFDDPRFPHLSFIEDRYSGDPTNWWIPNRACLLAMLRSAGFTATETSEPDVFLGTWRELPPGDRAGIPTGGRPR